MRRIIILASIIALTAFSFGHVFAADQQDMMAEAQTAQTAVASDAAASGKGEQATVKCPNCGEKVNIGRHGQTSGETMNCPHCGKEICTKEEAEKGICFGADKAFMSKYVSRGMTTNNDPVFEPNLWVSYKGFTASAWGNLDLTNYNGMSGNFNEVDYALDYSSSLDRLGYSAGFIYYTFPHTGDNDTAEFYAGLGYDVLLKPKLIVYYDFLQVDGFYGNFAFSHSFEVPEFSKAVKASFDLCAQVGMGSKNFNSFNFGCDHTAFTDMVLTASLPVSIFDNFTVKPTVSYSTALDRTIRTKNFKNDNIIWGAVLSASL